MKSFCLLLLFSYLTFICADILIEAEEANSFLKRSKRETWEEHIENQDPPDFSSPKELWNYINSNLDKLVEEKLEKQVEEKVKSRLAAALRDCSPTSPRNGYIQEKRFEDKKYFKIGEEINYFCDVGYSKKGVSTKKCTTYGRLIPDSSFKCIPDCKVPDIENGVALTSKPYLSHKEEVTFKCFDGYFASGRLTRTCSDGSLIPDVNRGSQKINCCPRLPSDRGVYASTDLVNPVLYANEEDNCVFTRYLNQQGKIVIPAQKGSDGQTYFVLIKRFVGGTENFKRDFASYEKGFGDQNRDFWLGLELAHVLTKDKPYKLRVELQDHSNKNYYASYSSFKIDSPSYYRLYVYGYQGNIRDSLSYHNGYGFSTIDRDVDGSLFQNCAYNKGGWWFRSCFLTHLTGRQHSGASGSFIDKEGISWRDQRFHRDFYSWKAATMLFKP